MGRVGVDGVDEPCRDGLGEIAGLLRGGGVQGRRVGGCRVGGGSGRDAHRWCHGGGGGDGIED